jgi:hypothetical protein
VTVIARGLDQVENAIVSWRLGKVSETEAWRVICDAVDRVYERPSTTQGAVEAERSRIAALIRDKAEGTWDPNVEAVLRAVAREITGGQ